MQKADNRPIDIVIAWVDGSDPQLKQKREHYKKIENVASGASAATRFASNDEIYYNIASILKYVPFCRHIYIVTDEQQPEFIQEFAHQGLCDADKIRIIDHKTIFNGYEQFLPTFNTRSIESMLWNIPDLSDYFIYMNDDFFFNQHSTIDDFIVSQKMVVYGFWRKNATLLTKLKYREFLQRYNGKPLQPKHTTAQMLSAKILGMRKFYEIDHYPHIVDKNILKEYFLAHPEFLIKQIQYKFRNIAQVNIITFMNHLKIQREDVILKPRLVLNYLRSDRGLEDFIPKLQEESIKYGCMQSLDELDADSYPLLTRAMNDKFLNYLPASLVSASLLSDSLD